MSTLATFLPPPATALAPLAQHRPGQPSPGVALARRCCPFLLRPLYRWGQPAEEPGIDQWQLALGEEPDQYLTFTVPMWVPLAPKFVFKAVKEGRSGNWRFAYAYTHQLQELSKKEMAAAQALLTRLDLCGLVRCWWD